MSDPLLSFDAQEWSKEFCRIAVEQGITQNGQPIDQSLMTAWFANALMRGYDQRSWEINKAV